MPKTLESVSSANEQVKPTSGCCCANEYSATARRNNICWGCASAASADTVGVNTALVCGSGAPTLKPTIPPEEAELAAVAPSEDLRKVFFRNSGSPMGNSAPSPILLSRQISCCRSMVTVKCDKKKLQSSLCSCPSRKI